VNTIVTGGAQLYPILLCSTFAALLIVESATEGSLRLRSKGSIILRTYCLCLMSYGFLGTACRHTRLPALRTALCFQYSGVFTGSAIMVRWFPRYVKIEICWHGCTLRATFHPKHAKTICWPSLSEYGVSRSSATRVLGGDRHILLVRKGTLRGVLVNF
jgi:hypothetical protein